jgi:hypothetical protein
VLQSCKAWSRTRPNTERHIAANGPRGKPQPSFNRSSAAIRYSPHVRFAVATSLIRLAQFVWQPWSPARVRLSAPEHPKALSMPPTERVRLRDRQDPPPLDERRQRNERNRVASSARRGFICRSTLNASCFLRNKFSAANCEWERAADVMRRSISTGNGPKNSDASPATRLRHVQESYTRSAP